MPVKRISWRVCSHKINFFTLIFAGLFLCFNFASGQVQQLEISFHALTVDDGLSDGVNAFVHRDKQGFVWISSVDGLNRFDGQQVKTYRNNPTDSNSIFDNIVTSNFFEDASGDIWFTSFGAVNVYRRKYDHFDHFQLIDQNGNLITEDYYAFYQSSDQKEVWIRTGIREEARIHVFHTTKHTDKIIGHAPGQRLSVIENNERVPEVLVASWLSGDPGCVLFDIENNELTLRTREFHGQNIDQPALTIYNVTSIDGRTIFMGSNLGLISFDLSDNSFKLFNNFNGDVLGVRSIASFQDYLLISTLNKGLLLFDPKKEKYLRSYLPSETEKYHLRRSDISKVHVDDYGGVWVSYFENGIGNGLDFADLQRNRFPAFDLSGAAGRIIDVAINSRGEKYVATNNDIFLIRNNELVTKWHLDAQIYSLLVTDEREVFVVGQDNITRTFNIYSKGVGQSEFNSILITDQRLEKIYRLRDGTILLSARPGVFELEKEGSDWKLAIPDALSDLNRSDVWRIFEDNLGRIYFSVNFDRLLVFEKNQTTYKYLQTIQNVGDCISFYEHPGDSLIYVASSIGALTINKWTNDIAYLNEANSGLPLNKYYGLLIDDNGNKWLRTERGIIRQQNNTGKLIRYGAVDGVGEASRRSSVFIKDEYGKFWVGGVQRLNVFHPDSIRSIAPSHQSRIVSISINNEPLASKKSDLVVDSLMLKFNENTVAFEFVSCTYDDPENVSFKYRLLGHEDTWSEVNSPGYARYHRLSPGKYTFEVSAVNSDGQTHAELDRRHFTVRPPIWGTTAAKIIYALAFLGLLWYLRKSELDKQKKRLEAEHQKVQQQRKINDELRKVDKLKDQFLANTSHELRTPLNGIIGLTDSLIDGVTGPLPPQTLENLKMISSSGRRLSNLVNDILDFSKMRNDNLSLHMQPVDIHVASDIVLTLLNPLKKDKGIKLVNDIPENFTLVEADENRLQQILYNLVGNAIKFTEKGSVKIAASDEGEDVRVSIIDTGIGIPEDKLHDIFKSFQQIDGADDRQFGGTGLGLAVTRELVQLHGGDLNVDSVLNEGSTFSFTLKKSTSDRKSLDYENQTETSARLHYLSEADAIYETNVDQRVKASGSTKILIVDDEPVNRKVLMNHLELAGFDVRQAANGHEALDWIEKESFELIILDIMMPGLSGFEVCRRIRLNLSASELPVIMLTAKNRVSDLVEGFSVGASDYLAKPFSRDELLARIDTHLNLSRIHSASGKFVPYAFLEAIGHRDITEVSLGDHTEVKVTVLFADIRDYTRRSESMSPTENFKFVNDFVGRMGPIIQNSGGFINQYLGDGIMAIFPNTVDHAVEAAVAMMQEIDSLNVSLQKNGQEALRVGIGMHTGPLIMGIIGDDNRVDPATIADTVNIASRLEGLTKYFKTRIIISDASYSKLDKDSNLAFRYLGKVLLKGKKEPTGIYECISGEIEEIAKEKLAGSKAFDTAIDLYNNGEIEKAKLAFELLHKEFAGDQVLEFFIRNCEAHLKNGLPENWDGTQLMTSK